MQEEGRRLVRVMVAICILIVLILVGSALYRLLSSANLTLVTNTPSNYLKISQVLPQGDRQSAFSKQATGKLSARVKPGTYQISVSDQFGRNSSARTINIKARQSLKFDLNPSVVISDPEPVYGQEAGSVFASSGTLLFIDQGNPDDNEPGSDNLVQLTATGYSILFPQISFKTIDWVSSGLGVAQDTNNNLYYINGSDITQIGLPFSVTSSTNLSFGFTRSQALYVSDGRDVYLGGVSGNFKKVYSVGVNGAGITITSGGVGKDRVAFVNAGSGQVVGEDDASGIVIINNNGQVTKEAVDADSMLWSPNDTYMVVSGDSGNILLNSSFQKVSSVPGDDSTVYAWLNDNTLLYNIDSQVWQYNVKSQQTQKLTQLATRETITAIYPSSDGSYAYFSDNNTEKTQLFRVGLNGQPTNSSLAALSIFMPEIVGGCMLNYANFNTPTIIINDPVGVSQQNCLSLAQGELQTYGLNINEFQYSFMPIIQRD